MKKVYYKLTLKQKSPLRIGNGENKTSDSDLMRDGRGLPFIPGSGLAGVLREQYMKMIKPSESAAKHLWGYIDNDNLCDSRVIVSDAVLPENCKVQDIKITVRDGVGLDSWGMAINGAKYDFEVVETDQEYSAVIEWSGDEDKYNIEVINGFDRLFTILGHEDIYLGARTSRGYGCLQVRTVKKEFSFPADASEWIAFRPFSDNAFQNAPLLSGKADDSSRLVVKAKFKIIGSFAVRVNTSRAERMEDGSIPDSVPMANRAGNPVIPGTSWAGIFRHQMIRLTREMRISGKGDQKTLETDRKKLENEINLFFGKAANGKDNILSAIRFNETEIVGGKDYSYTRNAVDRFTQAPRNSALFTTRQHQGGYGDLVISIDRDCLSKNIRTILTAALMDFDMGLMSVGGGASTGKGLCTITEFKVNDMDRTNAFKAYDNHVLEVKSDGI